MKLLELAWNLKLVFSSYMAKTWAICIDQFTIFIVINAWNEYSVIVHNVFVITFIPWVVVYVVVISETRWVLLIETTSPIWSNEISEFPDERYVVQDGLMEEVACSPKANPCLPVTLDSFTGIRLNQFKKHG